MDLPPLAQVIGPADRILPGERGPYIGAEIVRDFGVALRRAPAELIGVVAPGTVVRNVPALEAAIAAVGADRKLLAVSHDPRHSDLPTAAILADSAAGGATAGAASGHGVGAVKPLFGRLTYRYIEEEMVADVPWLIGAIAAEFARGELGRRVAVSYWM